MLKDLVVHSFSFIIVQWLHSFSFIIVQWLSVGFIFYVLVFFNSNTYIIAKNIMKKAYIGILMYSCFGVFTWKENKEVGIICFEFGILKKKPNPYLETFSVSFQNKYLDTNIWIHQFFLEGTKSISGYVFNLFHQNSTG